MVRFEVHEIYEYRVAGVSDSWRDMIEVGWGLGRLGATARAGPSQGARGYTRPRSELFIYYVQYVFFLASTYRLSLYRATTAVS